MISRSTYATDVRIRREAETLADVGHHVWVIGLGGSQEPHPSVTVVGLETPQGIRVRRPRSDNPLFRAARWMLLPNHRRAANAQFDQAVRDIVLRIGLRPDVVHAHDFPALVPGAAIAATAGAPLVYDSHELWSAMQRHGRPSPAERRSSRQEEGRLARRADAVVTVSDGAAERLADWHQLDRVHVVRNTFPARSDISAPLQPRGAVYSGRVSKGRDLETVFAGFSGLGGLELHVIGPRDGSVRIPTAARLHEEADLAVVDALVAEMGIGLVPLTRGPDNHNVALPNKLFEAVSIGAPVVAADLPELRKVVTMHGLGTVYEPGSPAGFRRAVSALVGDYEEMRRSVLVARSALDWSHDASVLLRIYAEFAGDKHGNAVGDH